MKKNFREVATCLSCKFCYIDDNPEFFNLYCNQDGVMNNFDLRPLGRMSDEEFEKHCKIEDEHAVLFGFICDEYQQLEGE